MGNRVLVTGELHPIALEIMRREGLELDVRPLLGKKEILEIISNYECLVTRSQTGVDKEIMDAGTSLKVLGRAAIGVDNIDVEYATEKGILVVNVPADNVVSAAEHTFALLLSTIRNVVSSNHLLQEGKWSRKEFLGVELNTKRLGIVGLGKVGSIVANIARGFGMEIYAYDPYISKERFEKFRANSCSSLVDLIRNCDVLTIHTPKTKETLGMIDYLSLKEMKEGGILVNCARGGIVDEDAILRLLDEGHLLRAGIDVFSTEPVVNHPLFTHPKCVCTPHLGASTAEAQERVGKTIALQVSKALKNRVVDHPVNMPLVVNDRFNEASQFCTLAERLGRMCRQLVSFNPSLMRMVVTGEELHKSFELLQAAFFKGYFQGTSEQKVNYVNSVAIAEQRGLTLEPVKDPLHQTYNHLMKLEIYGDGEPVTVSGTVFAMRSRLVELNGYSMDMNPEGRILLVRNQDKPGVIGFVGGLLGESGVNIARWELGRKQAGGEALGLVKVDDEISTELLEKIKSYDGIMQVKFLNLCADDLEGRAL